MADRSHAEIAPFARGYIDHLDRLFFSTSRILVIVDGGISISPSNNFGLSEVIRLLRGTRLGFARLSVTLATRDGAAAQNAAAGPEEFTYTGFRFDQTEAGSALTIDKFDQIWCFGLLPGNPQPNDPNSLDPAIDAVTRMSQFNPTSAAELEKLARWMDERQGGLFATGDHHTLGASMCQDIPRVSTMRRWSVATGVPTVERATRIDTNRPGNDAERSYTEIIEFDRQSDEVPQPIEWVPDASYRVSPFLRRRRPHPILCHPTLGPIDVFPDHPHEGSCFDPAEPAWISAHRDATFDLNGYAGAHYPTRSGVRPLPQVIAWGRTLSDPPYLLEKGVQPARRFPMVSVYDGQRIGLGRVVVDSTWHHWLDINLIGLHTAGDPTPLQKIERYYVNVAIWLASAAWRRRMTQGVLELSRFQYFGLQERYLSEDLAAVGRREIAFLNPILGPCWVTQFVFDLLRDLELAMPVEIDPGPWPCLTCPPIDLIEEAVLGGVVSAQFAEDGALRTQLLQGQPAAAPQPEHLDRRYRAGAAVGLSHVVQRYEASLKQSQVMARSLGTTAARALRRDAAALPALLKAKLPADLKGD